MVCARFPPSPPFGALREIQVHLCKSHALRDLRILRILRFLRISSRTPRANSPNSTDAIPKADGGMQ